MRSTLSDNVKNNNQKKKNKKQKYESIWALRLLLTQRSTQPGTDEFFRTDEINVIETFGRKYYENK